MPEESLTDAELVILSLICEQPMHGYQVEQTIDQRNMRTWTDLSTSSIYYILQRLEEKGFIERSQDQEPSAGVPRKVYRITPAGRAQWKESTLRALAQPKFTYSNFLMGLHNLWGIPAQEALQAVRTYREWLVGDLQRQEQELEKLGPSFFPLDVLFEYGFVLGEAELTFLADLITRLEEMSGESPDGSKDKENTGDERNG
jgi:DNA-binding PadR family transcriptional regulator